MSRGCGGSCLDTARSQLPTNAQESGHVDALRAVHDGRDKYLFDHLYACLSILDSKSQSLLGFNSIIVAVFAIFMSGDVVKNRRLAAAGMALTLASCLLLLLVVWVRWSTPEEMKEPEGRATLPHTLLAEREERTIAYRLGWYLSSLAALLVLAWLVGHLVVSPAAPLEPRDQPPRAPLSQERRPEPSIQSPRAVAARGIRRTPLLDRATRALDRNGPLPSLPRADLRAQNGSRQRRPGKRA